MLPILAVLCASLALSGCKSDTAGPAETSQNTQQPVPQRPVAAAPVSDRPVIVCFGDSLTAGYGTDPGQSYPDYLQQRLDDAGFHYHVVNAGVSGNTTKDGLNRIARVIAQHPELVVVEFGGNDGLRGLQLEQTQQSLASIVEQLQASGTKVVLAGITLPPDYGPDYIAKFNAMYPALAKKYHVPLLPFLLQGVYGVPGDMQDDSTHATAKGNQQVAVNVQRLIEPLLKR
ncbi:arylesterase [Granulicella mallensis]|uniref:Lysophospholipase n=1 Tax=Granulicella mallensis (strain ATCC BAA-1857 / DSM 23137 / MP5ACTX8) TaxID=682795 RepID=G8NYD6_GRAMM|nr:arylesterase [Granulicella mallensis]AEU37902.1 Lysophospholipase [Granulicella mallensis MP5ACTX8]